MTLEQQVMRVPLSSMCIIDVAEGSREHHLKRHARTRKIARA
jgi:hypothetical protein